MPTIQETIQKIREFADLPNGWHFGNGVAPPQPMIEQAILFVNYGRLLGLTRANAFPGVNGEVEIRFYEGERMLETTIEADNSLTIAEDRNDTQTAFDEGMSVTHAYERISAWTSSDLSIASIMILNASDFRVKPLTFAAANQFQWWTGPALLPRVDQFALTFPYTIQNKLESQLFTGLSTKVFSLQTSVLNPSSVPLVTTAIDTFSGEEEMLDECLAP